MEQSLLHWVDNRDVESGIFAVDPEGKQHVSRAVITAWEQAGRLLLGTKGCLSCCSVDGVAHVIVLGNALTIDGAGDGVVTILVTETWAWLSERSKHWVYHSWSKQTIKHSGCYHSVSFHYYTMIHTDVSWIPCQMR